MFHSKHRSTSINCTELNVEITCTTFTDWTLHFFSGNRCGITLPMQGYDDTLGLSFQFDYRETATVSYKTFQELRKHMHRTQTRNRHDDDISVINCRLW